MLLHLRRPLGEAKLLRTPADSGTYYSRKEAPETIGLRKWYKEMV
jgi:hypothetical protein